MQKLKVVKMICDNLLKVIWFWLQNFTLKVVQGQIMRLFANLGNLLDALDKRTMKRQK